MKKTKSITKETHRESTIELTEAERTAIERWQEPAYDLRGIAAPDLEDLARDSQALVRGRKVKDAWGLLRLILAYAVSDWPLRLVGAWASILGIADVSDVALLYRFRQSQRFVGLLIGRLLAQRNAALKAVAGLHLRLVDAMVVSEPGSQGTDNRLHVSLDLGSMCMDGISVTDGHTGESLAHHPLRADEIALIDRGYAFARSLGSWLAAGGWLVARTNWHNLPLKTDLGQRLSLIHWLQTLTRTSERTVFLTTPFGEFRLRLIARPLPPKEAQKARERVRKQARKKGRPVNPHTLLAAGFVLLLTNLPAQTWEASRVAWLYRLRWQVELHFKRLKSLLHFDHLRAHDPRLVQTYLLGKLLAALFLEQLVQHTAEQLPDWFADTHRPISLWRLSTLFSIGIADLILGHPSLPRILSALPRLRRYLCDPPRNRSQQLAVARHLFRRLNPMETLFSC